MSGPSGCLKNGLSAYADGRRREVRRSEHNRKIVIEQVVFVFELRVAFSQLFDVFQQALSLFCFLLNTRLDSAQRRTDVRECCVLVFQKKVAGR